MPIELLPSLLLTILAVGYAPGPANIYALSCALRRGRRKALNAWLGLVLGFITTALVSALLVHYVGLALGKYVSYIKYIGAAYLLYLAWKTMHSSLTAEEEHENKMGVSFSTGYLIQLCNAKNILFQLTTYSTFVLPYSSDFHDMLPVAALMLLGGPLSNFTWMALGFALKPYVIRHEKAVNIVMTLALVGCAAMIATL